MVAVNVFYNHININENINDGCKNNRNFPLTNMISKSLKYEFKIRISGLN